MSRISIVRALVALGALLLAAPAAADCFYPAAPTTLPDGATASHEQMVEAHRLVREFDADIRAYTVCVELDARRLLDDPAVAEEQKTRIRTAHAELNNRAMDHVERVVTAFNEQLRLYRERNAN